jgi:hypothetical protein
MFKVDWEKHFAKYVDEPDSKCGTSEKENKKKADDTSAAGAKSEE